MRSLIDIDTQVGRVLEAMSECADVRRMDGLDQTLGRLIHEREARERALIADDDEGGVR